MNTLQTPTAIKQILHQKLSLIGNIEKCALFDYPDYLNIGDHLIWISTLLYLTEIKKTQIKYVASINNFSHAEMLQQIGNAPIIFTGGGNLGDLWYNIQQFRENIISKYTDRPIIILPQTIYFQDQEKLKKTAKIFNNHPDLTLFTRESSSHQIAQEHFNKCRIILAPDIAFHLVDLPELQISVPRKDSILYLCRTDHQKISINDINLPKIIKSDWISYQWLYREQIQNQWYSKIPGIVKLYREGWQKGIANINQWLSRQQWQNIPKYNQIFDNIYNPSIHKHSWQLIHSGIYQLKANKFIITNRMHGHIMSILLNIPQIFMPGTYHKNTSFYQTWTNQLTNCIFAENTKEINPAYQQLLLP